MDDPEGPVAWLEQSYDAWKIIGGASAFVGNGIGDSNGLAYSYVMGRGVWSGDNPRRQGPFAGGPSCDGPMFSIKVDTAARTDEEERMRTYCSACAQRVTHTCSECAAPILHMEGDRCVPCWKDGELYE